MTITYFKKADVRLATVKGKTGYVRSVVTGRNEKAMLSIEIFDYDPSDETWKGISKKQFEVDYDKDFKRLERMLREIGI